MTNNNPNKAFVRQNIPEEQQQEFLNYFQSIKDNQNFSEWPLSKVQQIVNAFKLLNNQFKLNTDLNIVDQIYKDIKVQSKTKEQSIKSPEKSHYKSSINYLQELQKSLKVNTFDRKVDYQTSNLQNWIAITNLPSIESQKLSSLNQKPNLFQDFDQLLKSLKAEQNVIQSQNDLLIKSTFQGVSSKSQQQRQHKQRQQSKGKTMNRIKDKLYKQKMNEKIKCKTKICDLNCEDLIIQNHQMIHRIFLPDYALYHIKIIPSNIICKRNYDDFVVLRENLQKMYPCTIVPYLQNISWLSQSDITLINKNKQNLSIFLKKLISHPVLANTDIVKDFLSIIEHKVIKQRLQFYQKRQFRYLTDIQSTNGEYQLNLSEEQYRKIEKMPRWNTFLQNYFSSFNQLLQILSKQLKNIENTYSKLANMSIDMNNKLKSLYQYGFCQVEIKQSFEKLFSHQQEYYHMKKKMVGLENSDFNVLMIPLINDQKKNAQLVVALEEQVRNLNQKYIKRLQNEPQSPSSISETYKDLPEKQFKGGIWNESQNIKLLKYQISFINTNLLHQYQFYNKNLIKKLHENWQRIIQRQNQYTSILRQKRASIKIIQH